jgi:hypothetical protein
MIAPVVLGHYLFVYKQNLGAVRHYQLVQTGPAEARLFVVPGEAWNATTSRRLQADLEGLLGEEMRVTVEAVPDIALDKSGKRPIIKIVQGTRAEPVA